MRISVCEPTITKNTKKYVNECLDTNWISSNGRFIKEFEDKFAEYCGTKYAVTCSSGTAALHLALLAIGVGKEDEVIVPDFSMIATSNAVVYCGATPVFVDSDLNTWNIDINKIEEKITQKTKAIIVVHTYGIPVDMDKVMDIAEKYHLYVVEDAAEAHGAIYHGKKVGSLGHIAAFSFYGNKIITTGEGGMVTTDNKELADKVKSFKNHCFGEPRFLHNDIGYNYRMTNIQAAIGLSQLEEINSLIVDRLNVAFLYSLALCEVPGIKLKPFDLPDSTSVCWMFGILIDEKKFGVNKDTLMKVLAEKGIETRSFFFPLTLQPCYEKLSAYKMSGNGRTNSENSGYLYQNGLYLPSSGQLSVENLKYIINTIRDIQKEASQ